MKKLLIYLIGALMLGATWPALAGPDFQAIEQARVAQRANLAAQTLDTGKIGPVTGGPLKCPPDALVLPLDHGLRAQTTPGENRLRKARYEAQVNACADAAKRMPNSSGA